MPYEQRFDDREPAIIVVVIFIGGSVLPVLGDLFADLGWRKTLGHGSRVPVPAIRNLLAALGVPISP